MTLPVTTWLIYTLLLSLLALYAIWSRKNIKRWIPVAIFLLAAGIALPTALLPMGTCAPWRPEPGEYNVLGFKIIENEAIYVFLDIDVVPVCYTLPYSTGKANQLQDAAEAGGGKGVKVKVKGSGKGQKADGSGGTPDGEIYEGPPPVSGADPDKQEEAPMFAVP